MSLTWTNHDRVALNEFLVTDLGQKFIAYLEQEKPPFPDEKDLTAFALAGAIGKGYAILLDKIQNARRIPTPTLPPVHFIDTSDDPVEVKEKK
jgi:hypothetical protein